MERDNRKLVDERKEKANGEKWNWEAGRKGQKKNREKRRHEMKRNENNKNIRGKKGVPYIRCGNFKSLSTSKWR